MIAYLLKRLLLVFPTLFGILLINFVIVQFAPGGPVEQMIAKVTGVNTQATAAFSGGAGDGASLGHEAALAGNDLYRGARGLDPEFIKEIEKMYGFDKPAPERFFTMVKNYLRFDFGHSYFRDTSVIDLIKQKLPVSISLGLWSTLLIYLISIPLGIRKAVLDGTPFDIWTSALVIVGYAIPSFLFAILLIILFAGGSFWDVFPLRGLVSDHWDSLSTGGKIADYLWHITLPVLSLVMGGFASLTLLTKNSFLEEIHKPYVMTAKAKGVLPRAILYGHIFRNGMLIVVSGLPAAFIHIFFTSALLIEVLFSLDGLGLLAFESAINRDYPVVFGSLYMFTLIGLLIHIFSDFLYTWIDPRIDFDKRMAA